MDGLFSEKSSFILLSESSKQIVFPNGPEGPTMLKSPPIESDVRGGVSQTVGLGGGVF